MSKINISLLEKYLPCQRDLKILDAGCGTGVALSYLKKYGSVIGVDKSTEALKYAKKLGKVVKADIGKLPFKDDSFNLVVCLDVLYHLWVKDCPKTLKELNRVLKKDGFLLWREPALAWLKSSHDAIELGQRRFSRDQFEKILKKNSFRVIKISYANFFLFPLLLSKRLPEILKIKKVTARSDMEPLPNWLNSIFYDFLQFEAKFLTYANLPFGSSVICLAKKL